jgi:hypothetical protein
MPIYEFHAPQNDTIYSFYSPRPLGPDEIPLCPANSRYRMERVVSGFSITGRHKDSATGEGGEEELDDPRMEAAMAEMEKEMSGLDEDNPDPRKMGQLMRRMSEMTGEKLGGRMEEMVRKMEEGKNLEALEEEFGDELDGDEDEGLGGLGEDDPGEGGSSVRAALRKARRRTGPRRDPELYDYRDFVA